MCVGIAYARIDLPIHDERGEAPGPRRRDGVPGLYFVGRPFQYALTSAAVNGVGRDAGYVAAHIVRRMTMRARDVVARPTDLSPEREAL